MEIFNTTWKVLIPIFKKPTIGLTVREIARESNITHPTVSKEIRKIQKEGLIEVEERRREKLIRGNFENEEFVQLKKLYNLLSLRPLVEKITLKYPVDVIICFGSYSIGRDTEKSDIDLYIGYRKIKLEERLRLELEKKLLRNIQVFSGNLRKFPRELRENIINGVKVYGWLKLW